MGTLPLSFEQESPPSLIYSAQSITMAPFPEIRSKHSLTAKHVTAEKWAKLGDHVTKTSGFTLAKAIACAADFSHTSDMDASKITANVDPEVPVHSCRIRVGRSIQGFGLSPGITKQQRIDVEALMKNAFTKLEGDLAGSYFA